ncbi:MAG: methylated-DNA--[protein]-cysteine S-methyltransferase [Tissierellia bacterium]|nr:methylated-DNA--[protein]-cysteine S-methyltransferase [Tissierellia bacterium]
MKYLLKTDIADFLIESEIDYITRLSVYNGDLDFKIERNPTIDFCIRELLSYLEGDLRFFQTKIKFNGTDFQQKVWRALSEIDYGETKSYKEIAESIGLPGASRAVGMACSANPIMIILPCHRIIGKNGNLTGYRGGLKLKKYLLNLEMGEYR